MSKDEMNHPASEWGTDAQFLDWTTRQPSIIDQDFQQFDPDRNTACHVRRLKFGAGRGIKPPYSAVPMTHKQHMIQESSDGERKVLRLYKGLVLTIQEAREWFENAKEENLERWIEHQKQKRDKLCR